MLPNASRQLIQTTNDMETFSFGLSSYNRLDEEEERLRRADNADYLLGRHHSPEQDYHNSQEKQNPCDHGLKSPDDLSREVTPNSVVDNERRWPNLKESCYENTE